MTEIDALRSELEAARLRTRVVESDLSYAQGRMKGLEEGAELLKDMMARTEASAEAAIAALTEELRIVRATEASSRDELMRAHAELVSRAAKLEEALTDASKWCDVAIARKKLVLELVEIAQRMDYGAQVNAKDAARVEEIEKEMNTRVPPPATDRSEIDKIEMDLKIYGNGFGLLRPDGEIKHLPANLVMTYSQPRLASTWGESILTAMSAPILWSPPKTKIRGVDYPCEDCKETKGSHLDNGWYRCNNCGYPGQ